MDKPDECAHCGYETRRLREYDDVWLCRVCEQLPHANRYQPDAAVQTIARCTNLILEAIRNAR